MTKRNLLWVYQNIGDSIKAFELMRDINSLADVQLVKDQKKGGLFNRVVYHLSAYTYFNKSEYDSAIRLEKLAYDRSMQLNDTDGLALTAAALGAAHSTTGNLDSEFYYFQKALLYAQSARHFDIARGVKGSLASSFEKKGNHDSAIFYARQYYSDCKEAVDTTQMMDAAFLISKFYSQRKKYDSAYKYLSDFYFISF
jgi:tetratricopeptide (TPR) repeat protein